MNNKTEYATQVHKGNWTIACLCGKTYALTNGVPTCSQTRGFQNIFLTDSFVEALRIGYSREQRCAKDGVRLPNVYPSITFSRPRIQISRDLHSLTHALTHSLTHTNRLERYEKQAKEALERLGHKDLQGYMKELTDLYEEYVRHVGKGKSRDQFVNLGNLENRERRVLVSHPNFLHDPKLTQGSAFPFSILVKSPTIASP